MRTLNWKKENRETEWIDRFDKRKVKKKMQLYPFQLGGGGLT